MKQIYRVMVRGQVLESADLRKLLAQAVCEKRAMDRRFRLFVGRDFLGLQSLAHAGTLQPAGSGNALQADAVAYSV
jgi:hypothetical protein